MMTQSTKSAVKCEMFVKTIRIVAVTLLLMVDDTSSKFCRQQIFQRAAGPLFVPAIIITLLSITTSIVTAVVDLVDVIAH